MRKVKRNPAPALRVGTGTAADRAQLLGRAGHGFSVPETHPTGRGYLATAGKLGGSPTGERLIWWNPRRAYETRKPQPDFARLHQELQRHPHLTLQLAWEEYRQVHPDGYAYSRFCELYQRWRQQLDVVLRQEHLAGEKLFVDYAGATIPIQDPQGGPERPTSIFVAGLGASNYTYAEAAESQELENWIGSHIRAFEILGGVPKLVIPDNTRNGVNMVLSPIKGMKKDTICCQDRVFQKMVESTLDCFGNDRITLFSMPGDVKIDLAVNVF